MSDAEAKFPRGKAENCYRIGAVIYRQGPMTREALCQFLRVDGNARKEVLKTFSRMVESHQLISTPAGFDIPHQFRDQWAEVAGFSKKPVAKQEKPAEKTAETPVPYVGEIVPPRTPEFKPLSSKYFISKFLPRAECEMRESAHFVSMSTRVRTPLDMVGEA